MSDVDLRRLRFAEFEERLTVRLPYGQRQRIRRVAAEVGTTESEFVREAIDLWIEALIAEKRPDSVA